MGPEYLWLVLPIMVLAGLALRSRRQWPHFAPALDRDVLAITGDPEALLTGLAKLHRLQLLPLGAGGKRSVFAGPVEDWPRLQDLADRADIPPERLQEILDRPGSGEDRYPYEPADAEPSNRVFSKAFKRRYLRRQNSLRMAVEIGTPALTAYLVQSQGWHGVRLVGAYLAGLLLLFLIRRRLERFLSGRTGVALRRDLRDKLATEGFETDAWNATLVGLSPHAEPRNYENFLIWDVGFLVLAGGRLCYVGDRTRFALDRACVRDIYMGPGVPGWRKPKRVYLAWQDDARGVGGTLNLGALESRPWWRRGSNTAELEKRLREWLRQPAGSDELPPQLSTLPGPDFGTVASQSLVKLGSFRVVIALWMLYAAVHRRSLLPAGPVVRPRRRRGAGTSFWWWRFGKSRPCCPSGVTGQTR